jgi:ureidoacrylate peracid hydrolase
MNDIELPQDYVDGVIARRGGRAHVFETLAPAKTALVVVDMQHAFVAEGAPFEIAAARALVPTINNLAATLRAAGGIVVWVQATHPPRGSPEYFAMFFENFVAPDQRERAHGSVTKESPLHAIYDGLEVLPLDQIVEKCRPSAFIQGASDIEERLRALGVDALLICGVATNMCCETTARDAMMRGFKVTMVADANAANSELEHQAGLLTMFRYFGDVRTSADVIGLIDASTRLQDAAE